LSKSMKTAIFSRVSAKTFRLPFDRAASNFYGSRGPAVWAILFFLPQHSTRVLTPSLMVP
jgi:hypothetical protein